MCSSYVERWRKRLDPWGQIDNDEKVGLMHLYDEWKVPELSQITNIGPFPSINRKRGTPPRSPHDIKVKLRMLAEIHEIVRVQVPKCKWVQSLKKHHWEEHAKYILGILVEDMDKAENFTILLGYEHQVRQKALDLVMLVEKDMEDALVCARRDEETKERFLTFPMEFTRRWSSDQTRKYMMMHGRRVGLQPTPPKERSRSRSGSRSKNVASSCSQ
jgi:hypothetical protein